MHDMTETVLSSDSIYEGRVVKLSVQTVRLPDGKESKREVITHPGAVAVVALDEQGRVLLVRQYRLPAGRVLTEIPAGTLEAGEDPVLCANRELREETGYRAERLEALGGIFLAPGYTSEYIHLFLAQGLIEDPLELDDDEFLDATHVPLPEALLMIERGEICDAKSITALLRVARRFGI